MPALVVATLALQLWKTKTPGWESIDTVRICGVGIGWKPWQVIDVLGKPEYKNGDMAGGGKVVAIFESFESNVSVQFEYGTVQSIEESQYSEKRKANPLTNILSIDSLPKDIEQLYGKPGIVYTMQGEKLKLIHWAYPNGVTYVFTNGSLSSVDVSKDTWDTFQEPDWGIRITDSSGTTDGTKGSSSWSTSMVKGVLKNNRENVVEVVLRARWSYQKSDGTSKFADAYDSKPIRVNPHDDTVFEVNGGSILRASKGEALVYDVTVKSVTEL